MKEKQHKISIFFLRMHSQRILIFISPLFIKSTQNLFLKCWSEMRKPVYPVLFSPHERGPMRDRFMSRSKEKRKGKIYSIVLLLIKCCCCSSSESHTPSVHIFADSHKDVSQIYSVHTPVNIIVNNKHTRRKAQKSTS